MKTATNDEDKKKGVLDGVDTSKLTAEFRYLGRIIGYKADALATYYQMREERYPFVFTERECPEGSIEAAAELVKALHHEELMAELKVRRYMREALRSADRKHTHSSLQILSNDDELQERVIRAVKALPFIEDVESDDEMLEYIEGAMSMVINSRAAEVLGTLVQGLGDADVK